MKNYTVTVVTTETVEVVAESHIEAQVVVHGYSEECAMDRLTSYKSTVNYSAEEKKV